MVDRLSGVGRILEESAAQAGVPLASPLRQAIEELDAIIQAARADRRAGETDA